MKLHSNTEAFFLDFLEGNDGIQELLQIIGEHNDSASLTTVEKLLDLRNITKDTDPEVVKHTLRWLGINLPNEMIDSRIDVLRDTLPHLPDYSAVNGTRVWYKFLAFLLQAHIKSRRLYSADYHTFHAVPMGTTIMDGGNWYPTTHVELEVDAGLVEKGFDLTLRDEDRDITIETLMKSGKSESFAIDWFTNHVGDKLHATSENTRVVRMALFQKHMSEFYYDWCPVEEVLHSVKMTVPLQASLHIGASIVVEPKRYVCLGTPELGPVTFVPKPDIEGGTWVQFGTVQEYADGTTKTFDATVDDHELIGDRDGTKVYIIEPDAVTRAEFIVRYAEHATKIKSRITPKGISADPIGIALKVPNLFGSSTTTIEVWELFEGGRRDRIMDSGALTFTTSMGSFNGNDLILPHTAQDDNVQISVEYDAKVPLKTSGYYPVRRSVMDLRATRMELKVPSSVPQGQPTSIVCVVHFNDHSSMEVVPRYSSTAPEVKVVENKVISNVYTRDLSTVISAQYADRSGTVLTATAPITVRAPKPKLAVIEIEMQDDIEERKMVRPEAYALWVKESATQDQIDDRDPSIILRRERVQGRWTSFANSDNGIKALPSLNADTGEFTTPSVRGDGQTYSIVFSYQHGSKSVATSKLFDVIDRVFVPELVDTSPLTKVESGSTVTLPCHVRWNTGKETMALAAISVEYVPSESAYRTAQEDILEEIARLEALGKDTSHLDVNNVDFDKYCTLELSESDRGFYDPMLALEGKHRQLYYKGTLHGAVRVTMAYTYEGRSVENVRTIQLIPERSVVSSVRLVMPTQVNDRTRTFVQMEATYSNGQKEFVIPSNIDAYYTSPDDYTLIKFLPGEYTGMAIVRAVESKEPETFKEFREMRCSSWPVFEHVASLKDLEQMTAIGVIMNVRKTNSVLPVEVRARYFRTDTNVNLIVVPTPLTAINEIVYSRIEGATEFSAEVPSEGYSLVNTYRMPGYVKTVDDEIVETTPYTYEQEASSDWAVVSNRLFTVIDGERVFEDTDEVLATIDSDGYLIPEKNSNAEIVIRATFFDGFTRIVREMTVYMTQRNQYLTRMFIRGQNEMWDESSRNPTVEYEYGAWYIPYELMIILNDNSEYTPTEVADWSLGDRTDVEGVSIDTVDGKLYLKNKQKSDGLLVIDAEYSERSPITGQVETVYATTDVVLRSTEAITDLAVQLPASNITPNESFQLVAQYERRHGGTGSSILPDADSVSFEWLIEEAATGFTIDQSGNFKFGSSQQPQEATVTCIIREERTEIRDTVEVVCPGIGYPTNVDVVGFQNVRDDSTIQLTAMLSRGGTFKKEDVTDRVTWLVCNERGDVVTVPGISITEKGKLSIDKLLNDTKFSVRCVYQESDYDLRYLHHMTAFSSYPRYGTATFGINSMADAEHYLKDRLRSDQGGTFALSPAFTHYGYFAVRADYGEPEFQAAADSKGNVNTGWIGWNGANWPVTGSNGATGPKILEKKYDNTTDTIHLYRTNERAFGVAILTARYLR